MDATTERRMHPSAYSFMVFGALLALIGVAVFIKMGTQGTSAIKIGGFEFKLGGSALVIFVGGALIFALPIMYPDNFPRFDDSARSDANESRSSGFRSKGTTAGSQYGIFDYGELLLDEGTFGLDADCREELMRLRPFYDSLDCRLIPETVWCLGYAGLKGSEAGECFDRIIDCYAHGAELGDQAVVIDCEEMDSGEAFARFGDDVR